MAQPAPFEIVHQGEMRVASNGGVRLVVTEPDVEVFRRRGLSGIAMKGAAQTLLPQVNEFAGELLSNPGMDARQAVEKLLAIAGTVVVQEPQRKEWCVAKAGDVFIFLDGESVIVTRQDLKP